jgi:membrane protein YqaA with SNARE-associated domain
MKHPIHPQKKNIIAVFVITVVAAVIILSVALAVIIPNVSKDVWESIGYPSAFFLGLIGAASVVVPVPTTVALLGMAVSRFFNPALLGLAFGLGASIGQLTSYVVGYVSRGAVGEKHKRRLNALLKIFNRYGMVMVFFFALTPLPDSLLFIPMGLIHYSLWKVFLAALAGKISMSLIITHVGSAFGEALVENWVFGVVTAVLLILAMVVVFKIDWEKFTEKYLTKEKKKKI